MLKFLPRQNVAFVVVGAQRLFQHRLGGKSVVPRANVILYDVLGLFGSQTLQIVHVGDAALQRLLFHTLGLLM